MLGDGRAIDGQERLLAAVAVVINGARDQLLAGAAFAADQGGGIRGGELADQLEDLLHRLAAPDNAQLVIFLLQQGLVGDDLPHVAGGLQGVEDDLLQLGHVKRLEQIVVGAQLHRLDGGLRRAVGGHQDDQQLGIGVVNAPQGFQPREAAHAHVHDHEVGFETGDDPQALLAARRGGQLDVGRIEDALKRILHVRFVVN